MTTLDALGPGGPFRARKRIPLTDVAPVETFDDETVIEGVY